MYERREKKAKRMKLDMNKNCYSIVRFEHLMGNYHTQFWKKYRHTAVLCAQKFLINYRGSNSRSLLIVLHVRINYDIYDSVGIKRIHICNELQFDISYNDMGS